MRKKWSKHNVDIAVPQRLPAVPGAVDHRGRRRDVVERVRCDPAALPEHERADAVELEVRGVVGAVAGRHYVGRVECLA